MNELAKIVLVEPGKTPKILTKPLTLDYMQKAVGGYIETVCPFEDSVAIICNEEGKLMGLPLNRALCDKAGNMYDILCGTFLIVGITETDFCSLTDEQAWRYYNFYRNPQTFTGTEMQETLF